jgi:hypothetical protein
MMEWWNTVLIRGFQSFDREDGDKDDVVGALPPCVFGVFQLCVNFGC